MKILLVQDRLRGGGTERQTAFLARAFATRGHDTTLLTFRPGGALAADLTGAGIAHRNLQPFDTGLDWFAPGLTTAARRTAPDIVLCMGRMANCRAAQLQRALPAAAVVATVRTGKNLPWLYRRSLRAARHVIANSAFARRELVAPEGAADRCTVIPNALLHAALLEAAPGSVHAPATAGLPPPLLLCVAQFRREKNQRELLDIAAALPRDLPWHLAFVGDGPTRGTCERYATALGLGDRVTFHGWQAHPAQFYRTAAIAVLTSQRESLPNFLVEAQCAGVPVVSYDVGGAAECFLDGASGHLIATGDRAHFAATLAALLRDPPRHAAMATAARSWAHAQFDPERQVSAHLELFERLRQRS